MNETPCALIAHHIRKIVLWDDSMPVHLWTGEFWPRGFLLDGFPRWIKLDPRKNVDPRRRFLKQNTISYGVYSPQADYGDWFGVDSPNSLGYPVRVQDPQRLTFLIEGTTPLVVGHLRDEHHLFVPSHWNDVYTVLGDCPQLKSPVLYRTRRGTLGDHSGSLENWQRRHGELVPRVSRWKQIVLRRQRQIRAIAESKCAQGALDRFLPPDLLKMVLKYLEEPNN